jgi:pilus assembly protein Flp/PilA
MIHYVICFYLVEFFGIKNATGQALPSPSYSNSEKDVFPMRNLVTRFVMNDEGAALVEYGMLVGLIAVVCFLAVQTLGTTINSYFDYIATTLPAAP